MQRKEYKPSTGFLSLSEQAERKAARIRAAKARKKARVAADVQRKKQEAIEQEMKRAHELANERWNECLKCLRESVPLLKSNPWLIILEPFFIHDYLDSLTETLSNLSKHESDIDTVRKVLQDVYEAFVEVGRFAKYQPAFFIEEKGTLKRFVRLLDQVAHRGSDKALFPNVLSLLGPTFEREELYDLLAEAKIVHSLMSFVRTGWMPTPSTLALLLAIIEQLSLSSNLRSLFMQDEGFDKLQAMAYGTMDGFTKEQQLQAQQALALFPPPKRAEEKSAEQQMLEQAAAGGAESHDVNAPATSADANAASAPGTAGPTQGMQAQMPSFGLQSVSSDTNTADSSLTSNAMNGGGKSLSLSPDPSSSPPDNPRESSSPPDSVENSGINLDPRGDSAGSAAEGLDDSAGQEPDDS